MRNPVLFSRLFNTPLLIQPNKLDAIIAGIGSRFGLPDEGVSDPSMALTKDGQRNRDSGYLQIDNVAVIDIIGVLAHRGGMQADSSYILGYDRIGKMLNAAMASQSINSILLVLDSPGGEAAGAFELAAQIRQANQTKPVKAVISSQASSAGYLLASAAGEVAISATGIAGSIGVVMRHIDVSKMAENEGVSVTYIYAGDRKIDGNPYAPLPEHVKADFQAQIDKLYSLFVTTVAEYRNLGTETIRAQQAAMYTGQDAITSGLANRIATPDEMLAEMQHSLTNRRSTSMATPNADPNHNTEDIDAIRTASFNAGKQEGMSAGAKAERDRIYAIFVLEEAVERRAQAQFIALSTEMSADQAKHLLAASPKELPPAAEQSQFSQYMTRLGNPDIPIGNDDSGEGNGEQTDAQLSATVVALHHKLNGVKTS